MKNVGSFKFLLIAGLSVCLLRCAKKSESNLVNVTIQPPNPLLINAPYTYMQNGSSVTVNPPWFRFQASVDNTASDPVTISTITLNFTVPGQSQVSAVTLGPGQFQVSMPSGATTVSCNFTDFGEFDPGAPSTTPGQTTSTGLVFNNFSLFMIDPVNCDTAPTIPIFYVSPNISVPTTGGVTNVLSMTVQANFTGWFGTRISQKSNFQRLVTFTSTTN